MTSSATPPPTPPEGPVPSSASTRPYLIRALHDWCTDNGYTPYLAVFVDGSVQVPTEYVKNNEIVLNTSFEATSGLQLGNEFVSFKARFGGVAREIRVPIDHVIAIYARENGQGMAFPSPMQAGAATAEAATTAAADSTAEADRANPRGALRLAPAPGADSAAPAATSAPRPKLTPATVKASADDPDEPPPGGRPTLKRVK